GAGHLLSGVRTAPSRRRAPVTHRFRAPDALCRPRTNLRQCEAFTGERCDAGGIARREKGCRMTTMVTMNNYFYRRGGSEVIFFEHNRLLESLGWTVVPFSMKHQNNLATPWAEYFVDELEMSGDYSLLGKVARIPKVIYSFEARRQLSR